MSALEKSGAQIAGSPSKTGRQEKLGYERSFDEKPTGVVGDEPAPVGTKHKKESSSGETVDDELEADRKKDAEVAKERGEIPEKSLKKALDEDSMDMIKSLITSIEDEVLYKNVTREEVEFLSKELGFSAKEIAQGKAMIKGEDRQYFSEWLMKKAQCSVDDLVKAI